MRYLLKNGTVVSAEQSVQADVLIEGEKIIGVGKGLDENGAEVIDVSGKLLFPGFIDGHTHFDLEVAGTVTADDFETGTRAAIAGGTTLVIDYASQDKGGHTLKEGLEKWHRKADGKCSCDYSFHMSVVEWNEETEKEIQNNMEILLKHQVGYEKNFHTEEEWETLINKYRNTRTLTKEMVNAFVEKIEIHESGSITVRLVYDDMLEELRKYAKEREAELCQ